ncbi:MAG: hypothetical protein M1282_17015 [Chloroflexi bacterium]|nr:hypothetical protein [Chloroflexota bacterium]
MKRRLLTLVSILLIATLTACGPAPTPTLSAADIQNTAVPIIMSQIALTKAAIPTATSVPPTDVPPLPTIQQATITPLALNAPNTPINAGVPNPNATPTPNCYIPPTAKLLGTTVQIELVNKSSGPVNLSMGMFQPDADGECFTFSFDLRQYQSLQVTILSACYWMYGYQTGPKPSTPANPNICFTDTTQVQKVTINNDSIGG